MAHTSVTSMRAVSILKLVINVRVLMVMLEMVTNVLFLLMNVLSKLTTAISMQNVQIFQMAIHANATLRPVILEMGKNAQVRIFQINKIVIIIPFKFIKLNVISEEVNTHKIRCSLYSRPLPCRDLIIEYRIR